MFNGSLEAQVQGSCPGFQEVQRRESKVPLEGNSFHGLPLPLEQEARAPAVLQVPELAGAKEPNLPKVTGWLRVLGLHSGGCTSRQSVSKNVSAHSPVFSSRFFPMKNFLVCFLVSVRSGRIPSVLPCCFLRDTG